MTKSEPTPVDQPTWKRDFPYEAAAEEASVASALTVTRPGAQDSIPTRAEVLAAL